MFKLLYNENYFEKFTHIFIEKSDNEDYMKNLQKTQNEINKTLELKNFDAQFYKESISCIAGIDEAGRGPLAGPVVACAIILPEDLNIIGINDSKKISEKKRLILYDEIYKSALSVGIGMVTCTVIDEINILKATFEAMRVAVNDLALKPDLCLVDGNLEVPNLNFAQKTIIKGDSKSLSIAAASIIAKVTRDTMMEKYDELYPQYDFKSNKGYGTKKHIEAILEYGTCPIHRTSFLKKISIEKE